MTALWIAVCVLGWLAPGYLAGRAVYRRRIHRPRSDDLFGPVEVGLWTMFAGPFGAVVVIFANIFERLNAGNFWSTFFHVKDK